VQVIGDGAHRASLGCVHDTLLRGRVCQGPVITIFSLGPGGGRGPAPALILPVPWILRL
jgi:hypothetical protein